MATTALLLQSCALQIKVHEDWNLRKDDSIPLETATATWQQIQAGQVPSSEQLSSYNNAVRTSVVQIAKNWSEEGPLSQIQTTTGIVEIDVDPGTIRNIDEIDQVVPADFIRVKKGFDENTEVNGVGAPLMVRQRWSESDPLIPATGLWYPVTGILNFDQPTRPVLELLDPTRQSHYSANGRSVPLSVDYTATFARDFQDRQRQFVDVAALLRFEKYADRMGMYRVSAFDPEKQVCVLVHGINSTPMTWQLFLNQAYGEKEIRERYEFWTFGYPTGAPIPYLASKLRKSLHEMRDFRIKNGAATDDIVLVGHSMGGLLSKAATQRGGQADWDKLFTVPIEQLEVSDKDREILRELVYYEAVPGIERVILCAVPHRGSKLAAKPGAKLVGELVQVPRQIGQLTKNIVKQSSYALTPLGFEMAEDPNSIDQLSPASRITAEFLNKPLNPEVQFHSVIARKNPKDRIEESSDGIVPYTSSHIAGVVSERVIDNSPHGVHRKDDGIAEIIRILNLP
ncbi:MAG: putative lipase [Verrucomicrobiales bacterium]|nr:putative lipase [Verrucomicrobiales bacterium]